MVAMPFPQQDAERFANKFEMNIVLKFRATAQILTNQVSNLVSELLKSMCILYGI